MNATQSFFDELNNSVETTDFNYVCLITNEPLDDTQVKLECNHTFNYINLYMDACKQRNNSSYAQYILKPYQLRCPYCRNIQDKILPYKSFENVGKVLGVNYPNKYSMKLHNCKYVFKKGKNKGALCNKPCDEPFCKLHFKGLV